MPKSNLNNGQNREQKRRSIRLKNMWNRLVERKKAYLEKLSRPKGTTIIGLAKPNARKIEYGQYGKAQLDTKNQRKRRKLERQTGIRK